MHKRQVRWGLHLSATTLLASSLIGCAGQTHEQMVNDAEGRWHSVRSAIMVDMAETQFNAGQLEMCEQSVNDGLAVDPTNPKLLTLMGRVKLEQGRLERAYHLFNAAIEVQSPTEAEDEPAETGGKSSKKSKEEPKKAKGEPKKPTFPDPYFYQGVVLQRWQQYEKAYQRYKQAYEVEADNAAYLLAMGEMLVSMDRADEAVTLLESKLVYFDQNSGMRAAMGQLYSINGEHAKAAEMFRQASLLDPENETLREELAYAQIGADRYPEAVNTLKDLLKSSKYANRDDLWRSLAECYLKSGKSAEARQVYMDLVKRSNATVDDWIRLGELSWKAGDDGSTLQCANRAIRLSSTRHEGYLLAGLVWQKRGRLDDALNMYDRAAHLAPTSASPLILRGIALQKAGRLGAAADAYTEALRREPHDPRAMKLLKGVADAMN